MNMNIHNVAWKLLGMLELIVGWLFWTIKHANKWLFTSNSHFNATFRPSRASSGIHRCLTKPIYSIYVWCSIHICYIRMSTHLWGGGGGGGGFPYVTAGRCVCTQVLVEQNHPNPCGPILRCLDSWKWFRSDSIFMTSLLMNSLVRCYFHDRVQVSLIDSTGHSLLNLGWCLQSSIHSLQGNNDCVYMVRDYVMFIC